MLRRVMLAFSALALLLSACGRQVTPNHVYSALSGEMSITFMTSATMDFNHVNYVIAFNTSGNGQEPYPNTFATSYCNYSFIFTLGAGPNGGSVASPALYQVYVTPGSTIASTHYITLNPGSTTVAQPQANEFTITFERSQLDEGSPVNPSDNPCGSSTPTPTTSATPAPGSSPTAASQATWLINLITTDANNNVLDSMGLDLNATGYSISVDVNDSVTETIPRTAGAPPPSNLAAYITGVSIINYP
ncbi:MAG TPA: hypothetical protein VME66_11350 [Candidatus Acidoferrales bacterium]|nr:hypothetical protein [Candidatus Acidoferrales bacterium]